MNNANNQKNLETKVIELQQRLETMENILLNGKEVLSLEEASIFMDVTKSNLYRMTHENIIPFYKPGGKMCYFEKSELLKWMRSNRIDSEAEIEAEAMQRMNALARKSS